MVLQTAVHILKVRFSDSSAEGGVVVFVCLFVLQVNVKTRNFFFFHFVIESAAGKFVT